MTEPQSGADIIRGYKEARARILAAGLAHERRKPAKAPTPKPSTLTPELIIKAAAAVIDVSIPYMLDHTNHNLPFIARALAAYFMRARLGMENKAIGAVLANRGSQSISYAITNVRRNIGRYRPWMEAIAKRLS